MSYCETCGMNGAPVGAFHGLALKILEIEQNADYILSVARKDMTEAGVSRWCERRNLARVLLAEIEAVEKDKKGEVKV